MSLQLSLDTMSASLLWNRPMFFFYNSFNNERCLVQISCAEINGLESCFYCFLVCSENIKFPAFAHKQDFASQDSSTAALPSLCLLWDSVLRRLYCNELQATGVFS